MRTAIQIDLSFNGDKKVSLASTNEDYRQLLLIMFSNQPTWRAEIADGEVILRPATAVGKVSE